MTRRRLPVLLIVLLGAALVAASCNYVHAPFLHRLDQPVVLTGADLPNALGADPATATLWRYKGEWVQVPAQVDERHVVDFGQQPSNNSAAGTVGTVYGNGSSGVTALQYSDPDTFVGADPDPTFDSDDELVFLARDAGDQAPTEAGDPAGTTGPAGLEIALVDEDGDPGYVYLYAGTAGSDPSAGQDLVDYDFDLTSGDYKTTYKRADGPNPETSTVSTYAYDLGMIDRWKTTDLSIVEGDGSDILDGFKARFAFSTCGRSNDTFSNAEGAFVANIDGPVRGIRSYIGANSGPLTQETWFFYPDRIEQNVDLRVHAIGAIMSFIDWSPAASGMQYANSEMAGATVTVDGDPTGDTVPTALPSWEYVAGPQGAVTVTSELTTSATVTSELEWVDDATPPYTECWGDGQYYGVSANKVTSPVPNTDPRSTPFETFSMERIISVWPSGLNAVTWTPAWAALALADLDVSVSIR